jgi:fatty acyl-CoA reductase
VNHAPAGQWIARAKAGYFEVEAVLDELQDKIDRLRLDIPEADKLEQAMIELGVREAHRYGWNDTYTFTKWMGEQILLKALHGHALTILRPSIVESTLQEPVPGWLEGVKVADAVILAYAREKVTLFPGKPNAIIDIIPVDLVANAIILSTVEALACQPALRIYQVSSSSCNPLKIRQLVDCVQEEACENHARYDRLFYRKPQRRFFMIPRWIFHLTMLSGFFAMQAWSKVASLFGGGTTRMVAVANLDATLKLSLVFSFYTAPNYIFSNDKLQGLAARASAASAAKYPVSADCFDWRHYLRKIHVPGLNQYALKPRRRNANAADKAGVEQEKPA